MEFISRAFTPSNSDRSGMVGNSNSTPQAAKKKKKEEEPRKLSKTQTRFSPSAQTDEADVARKTLLGQ